MSNLPCQYSLELIKEMKRTTGIPPFSVYLLINSLGRKY